MSLEHDLRVVHYRDCMLYAQSYPGRYAPAVLAAGLTLFLWGIGGATGSMPLTGAAALALAGLGLLGLVPLSLAHRTWLSIDRHRGWVHWRMQRWPQVRQESFSPQRMESLEIRRRGSRRSCLGVWIIVLRLDHPRLPLVRLGWAFRLAHAHQLARRLAPMIGVHWTDECGWLHVAIPAAEGTADSLQSSRHGLDFLVQMPPPPEIQVEIKNDTPRFILPNQMGISSGTGVFLLYALIWCLWAWSSLIIEWRAFGGPEGWQPMQRLTMALLFGGSAAGMVMLSQAMLMMLGKQILEPSERGWVLTLHWLGLTWRRRPLEWKKSGWVRLIESPGEESGLWIPTRRSDIRLGIGHSSDSLSWLQQLLLTQCPLTRSSSR